MWRAGGRARGGGAGAAQAASTACLPRMNGPPPPPDPDTEIEEEDESEEAACFHCGHFGLVSGPGVERYCPPCLRAVRARATALASIKAWQAELALIDRYLAARQARTPSPPGPSAALQRGPLTRRDHSPERLVRPRHHGQ